MGSTLEPGQKFSIGNVDYYVVYENWTIVAIAAPVVTFARLRRQAVDIAYVLYVVEDIIEGTIVREVEQGVVVRFSERPHFQPNFEEGLLICGDKGWYLKSVEQLWLA